MLSFRRYSRPFPSLPASSLPTVSGGVYAKNAFAPPVQTTGGANISFRPCAARKPEDLRRTQNPSMRQNTRKEIFYARCPFSVKKLSTMTTSSTPPQISGMKKGLISENRFRPEERI